jgi:hypothetical protein
MTQSARRWTPVDDEFATGLALLPEDEATMPGRPRRVCPSPLAAAAACGPIRAVCEQQWLADRIGARTPTCCKAPCTVDSANVAVRCAAALPQRTRPICRLPDAIGSAHGCWAFTASSPPAHGVGEASEVSPAGWRVPR